jgi:hypothetical protein
MTKVNNKKVYFKCSKWLSELWIFVNHAISQNSLIIIIIIIMLLWKKTSKDDLVLTYGVAFLEIDWTSGSFFINGLLCPLESNQSHYMIFVFIGELTNCPDKIVNQALIKQNINIIKGNKQLSG